MTSVKHIFIQGDGEPDEDFPALDRKRILKQFGNVSEYCMCRKSGVPVPPVPSTTESTSGKSTSIEDFLPVSTYTCINI